LTVANDLMPLGYDVTIFEKQPRPGGLMRINIPAFRLPEEVLDEEIAYIVDMGVKVQYNSPIDSLKALLDDGAFDAVFVGTGAPKGKGIPCFLVEAGTPGLQVVRRVKGMGVRVPGGHAEIEIHDCRVPHSTILGGEGQGFPLTQQRLGPARLTHCMRWIGIAQRALELAGVRARERHAWICL
jgi:hypothetical protein